MGRAGRKGEGQGGERGGPTCSPRLGLTQVMPSSDSAYKKPEPRSPPFLFVVPHCCGALSQKGTVLLLPLLHVVNAEYL